MTPELLKNRIILALDMHDLETVKRTVDLLHPYVGCFKVGLELLMSVGAPTVVNAIHCLGGQVFLDGKFHDIPNTMAGAAESAAALSVKWFDVHASAGVEGMRAAVKAAKAEKFKGRSQVLAVTVLTSMDEETCCSVYGVSVKQKVSDLAQSAACAGVDGIICSPQDLSFLNEDEKLRPFIKITPGVRPDWSTSQDQKRHVTPRAALEAGATALVIGRPILNPPQEIGTCVDAAKRILDEIALCRI